MNPLDDVKDLTSTPFINHPFLIESDFPALTLSVAKTSQSTSKRLHKSIICAYYVVKDFVGQECIELFIDKGRKYIIYVIAC